MLSSLGSNLNPFTIRFCMLMAIFPTSNQHIIAGRMIRRGKMALSSCHWPFRKTIPTRHLLWNFSRRCFTQTVKTLTHIDAFPVHAFDGSEILHPFHETRVSFHAYVEEGLLCAICIDSLVICIILMNLSSLCWWLNMFGHSTKSMESYLWYQCNSYFNTISSLWPQS